MKQHITPQQQEELSKKGMKHYDVWYREHYAPYAEDDVYVYEDDKGITQYQFPPLSIGQMIEFLDEHASQFVLDYGTSEFGEGQKHWRLIFDENQYECDELCDALWEACKEVLEK